MRGEGVFILLGAGRSGTTLLYKILAAHRKVGYLSNYQNRYPTLPSTAILHRVLNYFPEVKRKAWFKEGGGAYFNERREWLTSLVPTPSEAESIYQACGLPLTPSEDYKPNDITTECLAQCFEKVKKASGASILLSKRTANNRRIPQLHQMLPGARFIHLIRDGRAVAYSLPRVAWWDDHVLFWSGRTPRQMVAEGADPLQLAARNWVEGMSSIEQGIRALSKDIVLEVRYENLLLRPRDEIQRMLEFMGVPEPDPAFNRLVETLNLRPRKEAWLSGWSEAEKALVHALQRDTLRRWGYL